MEWNQLLSSKRLGLEKIHVEQEKNRSDFQRDYDRLIFSAPFRRLQNKTQVFPLPRDIFVHNRLTHSLEVSCVGRSLGNTISQVLLDRSPNLKKTHLSEIGSIISAACLAHDLGNPPFGHSGEKAISTFFSEQEGRSIKDFLSYEEWQDIVHFEGNANALRLMTHQFEGRREGGFVMTYSTLASVVKYPYNSSLAGEKSKFGFFNSEEKTYRKIAKELGIKKIKDIYNNTTKAHELMYARHPLVFLVEAADDICYQIMDIEDAHKLKIISYKETVDLFLGFLPSEKHSHIKNIFNIVSDRNERIAYLRSRVIGELIEECTKIFVDSEKDILSGLYSKSIINNLSPNLNRAYRDCSDIAFDRIYCSKYVVDVELTGFKVIDTLLKVMIEAVTSPNKAYSKLLINRVSTQYNLKSPTLYGKIQAILDYISGMTDMFALDLYRKIKGDNLPSI